jgi:U3 small nucleolar RNA-associated protein 14
LQGEYEPPVDFNDDNDEELSEDGAFNSDDERQYGGMFSSKRDDRENADNDNNSDSGEEWADDEDADAAELAEHEMDEEIGNNPEFQKMLESMGLKKEESVLTDTSASLGSRTQKQIRVFHEPGGSEAEHGTLSAAKLSMDDLLTPLAGSQSASTNLLRKNMDALQNTERVTPLASSLATAKETRKQTFGKIKSEVSEWQEQVALARQQETIDFTSEEARREGVTMSSLVAKFQPSTSMEKNVDAILASASLLEKGHKNRPGSMEGLEEKKLSKEEYLARQGELARMKALMSYEKKKFALAKSIKSKMYRKIRKKQGMKRAEKELLKLKEMDPELAASMENQSAKDRAMERMSLKHKNTSKWVRKMLQRGPEGQDTDTRMAIADQLQKGLELRKRMGSLQHAESDDEVFCS